MRGLDLKYQIQLKTIIHTRLAYDLHPGVEVERLQGVAKGKKLDELKIKSKESIRCFYSLKDDSVLVTIAFVKKQEGQADKEVKLAVQRLKDYEKQKK
jgi:phage-related protein